uniref:Uncharacterized protein n=1 Tax=Gossypium raimondii TaxID=29730 RepID=A0A0D2PLB2_GOSRA|nr:hypothetical protein B456_008G004900 [Gossypium raimondii]
MNELTSHRSLLIQTACNTLNTSYEFLCTRMRRKSSWSGVIRFPLEKKCIEKLIPRIGYPRQAPVATIFARRFRFISSSEMIQRCMAILSLICHGSHILYYLDVFFSFIRKWTKVWQLYMVTMSTIAPGTTSDYIKANISTVKCILQRNYQNEL